MGRMLAGMTQNTLPNGNLGAATAPIVMGQGMSYDPEMGLVIAVDYVTGIEGQFVGAGMRYVNLLYLKNKGLTPMTTSKVKMTARQDLEAMPGQEDGTKNICMSPG